MKIKRGRPKKSERGSGNFPETKKAPQEGSLGRNRLYRHKDGTSCIVTYSEDKSKPEEIKYT